MLVLSRKSGESIEVTTATGEVIKLLVIRVGIGSVRLGVDAPGDCTILRSELLARESTDANGTMPKATDGLQSL